QPIGSTKGYEKLKKGYRYHGKVKEVYVYVVEEEFRRIIGCARRSYPQEGSLTTHKEERLPMMIQEVGYNPDLIDWAGIEKEVVGRIAEELEFFFKLQPQAQEKKHRQEHVQHMPMPAVPAAILVVVHTQIPFAILEALLDRPSHQQSPLELFGFHILGCVAEIVLELAPFKPP
ncbi:hypothetical protein HKBW3S42_02468, partial [Candidatus Hakubella thermalkaliphila]